MTPLIWLVAAVVAAAIAYAVGWPAWRSYRSRESRDLNTERYRAWRGTGPRSTTPSSEGMTREERRRIYTAAGVAALSVVALVAFFLGS